MRGLIRLAGVIGLMLITPAAIHAQSLPTRLVGEWTGILRLDNSSPHVALEFALEDSSLTGKVFADGDELGAMEHLSTRADTVHFKVGVYDFTGVVSGARMQVALIVFNGTTKNLSLVKTPPLVKPQRPATSGGR